MKKILYFIPAILVVILCLFVAFIDGLSFDSNAWVYLVIPILAGVILSLNKWWGCLFGIVIGALIIYASTQGEIHIINEMPIGIIVCIYYAIMGYIAYKDKRNKTT